MEQALGGDKHKLGLRGTQLSSQDSGDRGLKISEFHSEERLSSKKDKFKAGSGGTCLSSQQMGGRGRQISEFKASLVYRVSSGTARTTQRNPILKKTKKKKEL